MLSLHFLICWLILSVSTAVICKTVLFSFILYLNLYFLYILLKSSLAMIYPSPRQFYILASISFSMVFFAACINSLTRSSDDANSVRATSEEKKEGKGGGGVEKKDNKIRKSRQEYAEIGENDIEEIFDEEEEISFEKEVIFS